MPLEAVEAEARRLSQSGYREVVLTGIHLASYGRGMGCDLLDAVERVQNIPGIARIRLGSLEPGIVDRAWVERLSAMDKVCPQFHLSMQSGSQGVLRRMGRRYTRRNIWLPPGCFKGLTPTVPSPPTCSPAFPGRPRRRL